MKKIISILLVIFSLTAFKQADAQKLKFYYYPSTNVYYDVANRQYIYPDNGNWQTVKVLPTRILISNTPRYVVYNSTPNVWVNNSIHVTKYKHVPNGRAVGYYRNHPRNHPVIIVNGKGNNGNGRGRH
jgi:hypothetical protein